MHADDVFDSTKRSQKRDGQGNSVLLGNQRTGDYPDTIGRQTEDDTTGNQQSSSQGGGGGNRGPMRSCVSLSVWAHAFMRPG